MIAARYSTGGVANARPATNTTTNDPPSSRPRIEVGWIRSLCSAASTRPEESPPVTGAGAPARPEARRDQHGENPDHHLYVRAVGLLRAEIATRRTGSARSRRNKQHNQRDGDAGCHAAEPEDEQIEYRTWPGKSRAP